MITVKNVSKRYGRVEALRDVSFTVKEGEILGLLGPNGAGKTTTMKVLTGFFPPTEGSVEIGGLALNTHLIEIKRKVGYLPENVPLYGDMRVRDFLTFVARVKRVPPKRRKVHLAMIMQECGIEDVQHRIIKNLSKGYRQRVGLAQALVSDPDILILDEPTIGLDPKQIIEIRTLIKKMAGRKTVILSSHILPEVSMMSNRIIIINEGVLIASDTPENLHQRLQSAREISIVIGGEEAVVMGIIQQIPHVLNVHVHKRYPNGIEYIVSSDKEKDVRSDLASAIVKSRRKCQLLEMKTISLTLEDIFMKLVTKEEDL